jgi:hypothetical protein
LGAIPAAAQICSVVKSRTAPSSSASAAIAASSRRAAPVTAL